MNYPEKFDDDTTLYRVHDSLKVKLGQDYNPGDVIIYADGEIDKFPNVGIITLVDKCSDSKATSFSYEGKFNNSFTNIKLLKIEDDGYKNKKTSFITQQVMAEHHNAIKDSIISIQKTIGTVKEENNDSIYSRLNQLNKLIYYPKAWFEIDITKGIAPLKVKFTNRSNGTVGPVGKILYTWYFENETEITEENIVEKTFENPGIYSVGLKVENDYGSDYIEFKNAITVILKAPEESQFNFLLGNNQMLKEDGNIRTLVNETVQIEIPNKKTKKKTFAGEYLNNSGSILDPIVNYEWDLNDNFIHENSSIAKAIYNMGGTYDLLLKTHTNYGSFRITEKKDFIDVIEEKNLWLWNIGNSNNISSYEFGLYSETFKSKSNASHNLNYNLSFLENDKNQEKEFLLNNGFAKRSNKSSGYGGTCILYWASGRSTTEPVSEEKINFVEYNGFTDVYYNPIKNINQPWNWASFSSNNNIYFALNKNNLEFKTTLNLVNYGITENKLYNMPQYLLSLKNKCEKYRTCWHNDAGYLLKNNKYFYKTYGNVGNQFMSFSKLNDLPVNSNDGSLVALNNKLYFFSNSEYIMYYNVIDNMWHNIGPMNKMNGNDDLLVCSDNYNNIYLSFGNDKFYKFVESSGSLVQLNDRPNGKQWMMNIF